MVAACSFDGNLFDLDADSNEIPVITIGDDGVPTFTADIVVYTWDNDHDLKALMTRGVARVANATTTVRFRNLGGAGEKTLSLPFGSSGGNIAYDAVLKKYTSRRHAWSSDFYYATAEWIILSDPLVDEA